MWRSRTAIVEPLPMKKPLINTIKKSIENQEVPHYIKNPHESMPGFKQQSQYWYISQFVNFEKISKIGEL